MTEKKLNKLRAASDHRFALSLPSRSIGVRVIEGKLIKNVSTFGQMEPYVKLIYANQTWVSPKSETPGKMPRWDTYTTFTHTGQNTINVIVLDTVLIFSEKEIGRCTIRLQEGVHAGPLWQNLINDKGEVAGGILLSFDWATPAGKVHYSNSSWDLMYRQSAQFESPFSVSRARKTQSKPLTQRTPDTKGKSIYETEELGNIEDIREKLSQEHTRLITQENKLTKAFNKFEKESEAMHTEKLELKELKQDIRKKEENLMNEKKVLTAEKQNLAKERGDIEKMKEKLKKEFFKLKQEKVKVNAHSKLLTYTTRKIGQVSKQIEFQKGLTKNMYVVL